MASYFTSPLTLTDLAAWRRWMEKANLPITHPAARERFLALIPLAANGINAKVMTNALQALVALDEAFEGPPDASAWDDLVRHAVMALDAFRHSPIDPPPGPETESHLSSLRRPQVNPQNDFGI
jgi:hypothetical protein